MYHITPSLAQKAYIAGDTTRWARNSSEETFGKNWAWFEGAAQ
jgi:hypothetical protein